MPIQMLPAPDGARCDIECCPAGAAEHLYVGDDYGTRRHHTMLACDLHARFARRWVRGCPTAAPTNATAQTARLVERRAMASHRDNAGGGEPEQPSLFAGAA